MQAGCVLRINRLSRQREYDLFLYKTQSHLQSRHPQRELKSHATLLCHAIFFQIYHKAHFRDVHEHILGLTLFFPSPHCPLSQIRPILNRSFSKQPPLKIPRRNVQGFYTAFKQKVWSFNEIKTIESDVVI